MTTYTAPLEDMMFLYEKLRNNKNYNEIEKYKENTGVKSAVVTATGKIDNVDVVLAIMNFEFIGI